DEIERRPRGHFPCTERKRSGVSPRTASSRHIYFRRSCETDIVIFVLAGVVDYRANIKTSQPCVDRAVVEQTEIGPIPWQRTSQSESRRNKLARDAEPFCIRPNLKLTPGSPGAVGRCR